MVKQMQKKTIGDLIARFMDGDTTVAEEQVLAEYFRTADDIPDEWQEYKDMFAYFDDGMAELPEPVRKAKRLPLYPRQIAAAAVVLVVCATIAFFGGYGRRHALRMSDTCLAAIDKAPMRQALSSAGETAAMPVGETPATDTMADNKDHSRGRNAGKGVRVKAAKSGNPAGNTPPADPEMRRMQAELEMQALRNEMVREYYSAMPELADSHILLEDTEGNLAVAERNSMIEI